MAKSKKLIVPVDVTLYVDMPDGKSKPMEEPVTFCDFVRRTLLRDKKWGEDLDHVYSAMGVRGALKDKVAGDEVEIDGDDYKLLLDVMQTPSKDQNGNGGYHPEIAVQLGTFFDAIKNAEDSAAYAKRMAARAELHVPLPLPLPFEEPA